MEQIFEENDVIFKKYRRINLEKKIKNELRN